MRPRQFDLIAFDWDGTLFDSKAITVCCVQAAVVDVTGIMPSAQLLQDSIGLGLMQTFVHAVPNLPLKQYSVLMERYRHYCHVHQHDVVLFDGVLPMLVALKTRHHWLTVATGKSRQGLDKALQVDALKGVFNGSRTADETASKPNPLMLHELMHEFGVAPGRTLMVGDTTHDLQMAANAGCASVGVSFSAQAPKGLQAWQPLYVAQTVRELHDWLDHNA